MILFQTMHPNNLRQIMTNGELTILLKNVFEIFFGDVVAAILIF